MTDAAVLPHNDDAERTLLGAVLVNPAVMAHVETELREADFYRPAHKDIFAALMRLSAKGTPPDLVTLRDELDRAKVLEACGGIAYVAGLTDGVPRITNVEHWTKIVRDRALARRLIESALRTSNLAYRSGEDAEALVEKALTDLIAINDRSTGGFVSPQVSAKEAMVWFDALANTKEGLIGLPIGIAKWDYYTGGLRPGQLVIIAARPAMGKTAFAVTVGDNIAALGKKVAFMSLEMSHTELTSRRLAKQSGVSKQMLRYGTPAMKAEATSRLAKVYGEVANADFWIDDTADLTVEGIRARARRFKAERGLDLLMVDYLQLVTSSQRIFSREGEVSSISRGLKQLAKELQVPVIALSQLNRKCEERTDKRPILSDLRESGAIEQDSDIVAFLYREHVYDKAKNELDAEILCRKQRDGESFEAHVKFESEITKFSDYPTEAS